MILSVWLAPDDTWRLPPLKVGSIDTVLSGTILDINIHPISFHSAPDIFQIPVARVSRGGIYKIKIYAEILKNPIARVSRVGIYLKKYRRRYYKKFKR